VSDVRGCFAAAASAFATVVSGIGGDDWDRPGLGEWTVRDLVGHASRALTTIETYLAPPHPESIAIDDPLDYFLAISSAGGLADPGQIAQRGREAAAALGPDPVAAVRQLAERVLALVAATPDDAPVRLALGGATLVTYLPTRTLELTVHTLDLLAALGAVGETPVQLAEPVAASLELAARLAGSRADGGAVLLALTGRRGLAPGFSVL
jgi:uncharacterized protein (TIGR03083 family)